MNISIYAIEHDSYSTSTIIVALHLLSITNAINGNSLIIILF